MDDDAYMNWIGIPEPKTFPDPDDVKVCFKVFYAQTVQTDLQALFCGVLMAKAEKIDSGLQAHEFEELLQLVSHHFISIYLTC